MGMLIWFKIVWMISILIQHSYDILETAALVIFGVPSTR